MEAFRAQMWARRLKTSRPNQYFVPQDALHELITINAIHVILRECNIEAYQTYELACTVIDGAQKVFAVLVLLRRVKSISNFICNDYLDHKMPFSLETLKKILPQDPKFSFAETTAEEFYEQQWIFSAPVFSKRLLPRALPDEIILPIIKEIPLGEGNFGFVSEIEFHPSHQKYSNNDTNQTYIGKQFIATSTDRSDYELELRNLSILDHLKHPNIIELLSAFTYEGKHSLIFVQAKDGDLAKLLRRSPPPEFQTVDSWVEALCKLSSAITRVHNFNAKSMNLIGCHYDLKPTNILVDGASLKLADFGLSRFINGSMSSAAHHRMGQGDYLAPECEDLTDNFQKGIVHRSSDIWSFGCIIAEILTYIIWGTDGVERFKAARRYTVKNFVFYHFHNGPGQPSLATDTWILSLNKNKSMVVRMLIQLTSEMLFIEQDQRPTALNVEGRLKYIALTAIARQINVLYDHMVNTDGSAEVVIEATKFKSWMVVCRIVYSNAESGEHISTGEFNENFQDTLDCLQRMKEELERIIPVRIFAPRVFSLLRCLNDCLLKVLPLVLQAEVERRIEYSLTETQSLEALKKTQQTLQKHQPNSKSAKLTAIKQMLILIEEHSQLSPSNLEINQQGITLAPERVKFQSGEIGQIFDKKLDKRRQILIEWIRYEKWTNDQIGRERLVRVDAIAALLNMAEKPNDFRGLHCSAYFHDWDNCRFGLVFDFPHLSSPVSLRSILGFAEARQQPTLGDRFHLAHALAASVAEFHKVGWLHKNVSSSNVVFFPPKDDGSSPTQSARQPYIIGFSHSRPNDVSAFTAGPLDDDEYRAYQHPDYISNPLRYQTEYDYYSLGLVLLEIGYWKSLKYMTRGMRDASSKDIRENLLRDRLPGLRQTMGVWYFEAVETCLCLREDFAICKDLGIAAESQTVLHLKFEKQVVKQLARCLALD